MDILVLLDTDTSEISNLQLEFLSIFFFSISRKCICVKSVHVNVCFSGAPFTDAATRLSSTPSAAGPLNIKRRLISNSCWLFINSDRKFFFLLASAYALNCPHNGKRCFFERESNATTTELHNDVCRSTIQTDSATGMRFL